MNENYTVGYDGSSTSKNAVMWTAAEAARNDASVTIVACYSSPVMANPWMPAIAYDDTGVREAIAASLTAVVDEARDRFPKVEFDQQVAEGSPRTQLVAAAADSSLLVVGATGAGEAASLLLGSVAHAVARTSPCPAVLVRQPEPVPAKNRIVVGTDGSEGADEALQWAIDEADRRDAELVVVHAWDYPYGTELSSAAVIDLMRVDAALVLEEAVRRCRDRGAGPVRGELVEGPAAPALLEHAQDADLVVVGSRGRGSFRSLLFGSVAHRVAAHATCPAVVVRA